MILDPVFLDVGDVLAIHRRGLDRFGGSDGVREPKLLDSAVSQPRATFGEAYLHEDLFQMAAAYHFHIVKNHPFVDGNKRAGLAAALVVLDLNGHPIDQPTMALYDLTDGVASGKIEKAEITEVFGNLAEA
ncbi:type II toxin-antitoxin system death-on-curing family toxin [Tautonia rosea]|uniref:type II toxin-antitoxin system death-on-curing family toxin n=1 Tax=Tautonia rosea TaxID=2728037 RepID=UPI0019D13536|nr:type II toxin-antitoxin system death-on-curing family toxin [Tautonia rosea]